MPETQEKLIALLTQKQQLLERVIPYLEDERGCILESNLERLAEVMEKKTALLNELQELTRRCRGQVAQLAGELGMADTKSLSPLVARLPEPQRETLHGLQGALLQMGERFDQLLRGNGDLLSGALGTVNRSLEFFGRLLNRNATYGGAGRIVDGAARSRIVCREI